MPYLRFNIDFKHQGVSFVCSNKLFKYEITIIVGNFENFKCKCDQGKATLDGIEFRVRKMIYEDICIKVHGLSGWGS